MKFWKLAIMLVVGAAPVLSHATYFDIETGTLYNMHRDLDPTVGRYIQSDPLGQAAGINTYLYVYVNPLKYVDPLGLVPVGSMPDDPSRPAVFINVPKKPDLVYEHCVLSCFAKRQLYCIGPRGAGMLGGVSVAAVGSAWTGGAAFPVLVTPSVLIGGNVGAGACVDKFFPTPCTEECKKNTCPAE